MIGSETVFDYLTFDGLSQASHLTNLQPDIDYLTFHCKNNNETRHLNCNRLSQASYLTNLQPHIDYLTFYCKNNN